MSVLRRGYVPVEPDTDGFDEKLKEQFKRQDPGGKAGKQIGGQLNRALKRLDLDPIDVKADPKKAFAAIEATEAKLRKLARESATVEVKVKTEQALSQLGRFKKQLGEVGLESGAEAATGFAARFGAQFGPLMTRVAASPPVAVAGAVLAAGMAPALGAGLASAVIGGAGVGGVLGGVALVARDPLVAGAGKQLGATLFGGLEDDAQVFVGPVLAMIGKIEDRFELMRPRLQSIFANSAGFLEPLVNGTLTGVDGVLRGVDELVARGGPVIESFGRLFAETGEAIGDASETIAGGSSDAALAVDTLTFAMAESIRTSGRFIRVLTETYGFMHASALETLSLGEANTELGTALDRSADGTRRLGSGMFDVASATTQLIATEDTLKSKQTELTTAQQQYTHTLDAMGGATSRASMLADGLRKATENLRGAQEKSIDANEAYEASWDGLSESVKSNKSSLDSHTKAGRANRDALQGLLTANRDLYFADVNSGLATDKAKAAHDRRTEAVRKEAAKVGLNKKETDALIKSYGRIPPDKATKIIQTGVDAVVKKMMDLYVYQRSLAEGLPVGTVRAMLKDEKGPAKRYGGYHEGGWTGPGSKYQKAGDVHADEFVIKKDSRRKIEARSPGLLAEMNATGQLPGYAAGGWVGAFPVEPRDYKAVVTGKNTDIPTRAEVAAKVIGQFGDWPSSPAAQRGDSGVWRKVVALIKSTGPLSGSFGNSYRPGDPKWHGSGRAVDWMGYNQDALATFLANRRPLELIHRGRNRDYAYTRGVNKGSFNESLMNAHRNHIHIAMNRGGTIREPVVGVGAKSGNSYSFGEQGPETVTPGGGTGGGDVHFHFHGPVSDKKHAEDLVVAGWNEAKRHGRIK